MKLLKRLYGTEMTTDRGSDYTVTIQKDDTNTSHPFVVRVFCNISDSYVEDYFFREATIATAKVIANTLAERF